MSTPVLLYQTSTMTDAKPVGKKQLKFPLPQQCPIQLASYAFDQEFEMALTAFPPAQKNAVATAANFNLVEPDPNAILVLYSQPQFTGGIKGRFKATFAIVPASWDDFATQSWTPPGWLGSPAGAVGAGYTARDAFPIKTDVRQHHDYFIVDTTGTIALKVKDSGANVITAPQAGDSLFNGNTAARVVASPSAIPLITKTYFCNTLVNSGNPPQPIYSSHTNTLVPQGGYELSQGLALETFPNVQAYKQWTVNVATILKAGGNPWTGLVWDGGNGLAVSPYLDQPQNQITQIILDDCEIRPYMGNIWERITTYVLTV